MLEVVETWIRECGKVCKNCTAVPLFDQTSNSNAVYPDRWVFALHKCKKGHMPVMKSCVLWKKNLAPSMCEATVN